MKISDRYGTVLRCYDAGERYADRYTIIPPRWSKEYRYRGAWQAIGANAEPFHPLGIGYHCEVATPNPGIGKRVRWDDLPVDVQRFARQSFPEYAPCAR